MKDRLPDFVKGTIWIGLIFMIPGGLIIWQGVFTDIENMGVPRWVAISFGMLFFNAGIAVALTDKRFSPLREKIWFSCFHIIALLSAPFILLALFNWVAFGPGDREFSMSISIPFISAYFERGNEIFGRLFIGVPVFLVDLVIGYVALGTIYGLIKKWLYDEE